MYKTNKKVKQGLYMTYDFITLAGEIKKNKYKQLGIGSSRYVYDLENGYVLKIAKDIRGIYQNEIEFKIYQSQKSGFFAEVIEVSEDNKCLIMSKAKLIKHISTVYNYYKVRNINGLLKINNFSDDIHINNLSKGDILRVSSWGIIDERPVLIDYGLTSSIYKKYYGINSLFKNYKRIKY